jgi:hypothetical protein
MGIIKSKIIRLAGYLSFLMIMSSPMIFSSFAQATTTSCGGVQCVTQSTTGPGGVVNACSINYCLNASLGDTGIGNSSSANYQAYAGYTTTADPYIELVTPNSITNVGVLDSSSTKYTTAQFSVRAYLASGYTVINGSSAPTALSNGITHYLSAPSTPAASAVGTEQFGINLASNTVPASIGAVPQQLPSNSYSYGTAAAGYNTSNLYKYAQGDTIAQSSSSSGYTTYTVSYIFNISPVTPSGFYSFTHTLIATGYY